VLSEFGNYAWWWAVTSTTVGYGDSFPATTAGRFAAVLWVMTGGIALFTATIGKTVAAVAKGTRARMDGLGDYGRMEGHLVVLGWRPGSTGRAIDLFLADHRYDHDGIVLVDAAAERNPVPASAHYVRTDSLTSADGFRRSGLARSEVVAVFGRDDAETLTVALAAWAACERDPCGTAPRIVASFSDASVADILRAHCPSAEVNVSLAVETMVRSAQDPGSSEVLRQLLSPADSPSQYSLPVPASGVGLTYGEAFLGMKSRFDATVVGLREPSGAVVVNAANGHVLAAGSMLYIVAAQRILPEEAEPAFAEFAGAGRKDGGKVSPHHGVTDGL
jgi:voltage-gated potassium channel